MHTAAQRVRRDMHWEGCPAVMNLRQIKWTAIVAYCSAIGALTGSQQCLAQSSSGDLGPVIQQASAPKVDEAQESQVWSSEFDEQYAGSNSAQFDTPDDYDWLSHVRVGYDRGFTIASEEEVDLNAGENDVLIRIDMPVDHVEFEIGFKEHVGKHPHQSHWDIELVPFV